MLNLRKKIASGAVYEGKALVSACEELLQVKTGLLIAADSKYLFVILSTCRDATDKSIRANVSAIRCECESKYVSRMIRVSGKPNLADPLTMPNSRLASSFQLLM